MATPWDRAAQDYVEEWGPRFVPYHLDLVHELSLSPGQQILVTSCGPGAEALAAARAVGDAGFVRATDGDPAMVAICADKVKRAGFAWLECAKADAGDTTGGPWDAIICAFGLWKVPQRVEAIRGWAKALGPEGKVGILTWGPPDADDPFERAARCLTQLEPAYAAPRPQIDAERDAIARMFEEAGLTLVRHTVARHTLSFRSAEAFLRALCLGSTWYRVCGEIEQARLDRVAAAFYDTVGGPDAPLTFAPPATLAIATLPGAKVQLATRASMRVPG